MRITIIFALTIFLLSSCGNVYAKDIDIGTSLLHPAHPLYFLKTIREDIELKLASTDRVIALRQLEFATRRIREAKTIASISPDLIPPTLERYYSNLTKLPSGGTGVGFPEALEKIREGLSLQATTLEEMYTHLSDARAKMSVRAAINRISLRGDVPVDAKLSACNFLSREASSSALNQTEKGVLIQRAQSCFDSLKNP